MLSQKIPPSVAVVHRDVSSKYFASLIGSIFDLPRNEPKSVARQQFHTIKNHEEPFMYFTQQKIELQLFYWKLFVSSKPYQTKVIAYLG